MLFYSNKDANIDEDSLELIYFFIPEYTVFYRFGISLHPKYNVIVNDFDFNKETINITIKEKENFVDLFPQEKINLKIICGKNGCGKTTLLKLLSEEIQPGLIHRKKKDAKKELSENPSKLAKLLTEMDEPDTRYDCIYIFKDKDNQFISNKKAFIHFNNKIQYLDSKHNHISFSAKTVCVTHKNMGIPDFSVDNNIARYFHEYPFIFHGILPDSTPLFTHFNISLKDFNNEFDDLLNSNMKDLLSVYERYELIELFKSDWILYYYLHCLRDTAYEYFIRGIRQQLSEDGDNNFLEILSWSLDNVEELSYSDLKKELDTIKNKDYLLKDINSVQEQMGSISKKIQKLICLAIGEEYSLTFGFDNFIKYTGFSNINNSKRTFYDLSTGEQLQFIYRYQIFHSLYQDERIFWYIDEPDEGLHPEWCRTFIRDYLNTYEKIKNIIENNSKVLKTNFDKNKRITILFSTHSPFILSDVTNDYISYLEKNEENYTKETFNLKNSFAGNIGEMFSENFFMTKTIGELATIRLKELIAILDSGEKISPESFLIIKNLINSIGDDLLRSLLSEKLENFNEKNRIR